MMHSSLVSTAPSTAHIMRWVIAATLPGLTVMTYYFGLGVISNVLIAAMSALCAEALILKLRQRPLLPTLTDYSAILTGILLGASLPPASPWWLICVGTVTAIIVAKQLYGGLGHNPFNPAMVGYALLLVSFPAHMTLWPPPQPLITETLGSQISGMLPTSALDSLSGATPLDAFKHKEQSADLFWASQTLPPKTLDAWRHIALAWLVGGLILLAKRIISWHIPVALLGSMLLLGSVFYVSQPEQFASPALHLLAGATMFGAFFIATDPVTAATSHLGKLIYGASIGLLVIVIRVLGGYPDAIAFAVLLINLCVPLIDQYTLPKPLQALPEQTRTAKRKDAL